MKITRRQLRRIIKEEKQKLIAENRVRQVVRKALLKEATHEWDAGIERYASTYSDKDTVDYIEAKLSEIPAFHLKEYESTGAGIALRQVLASIQGGGASNDWKDLLKMIPDEIKDNFFPWKPRGTETKYAPEGAKGNKGEHPYDASINDAVDVGYLSNSDAVEEVQGHLRSAGALELVGEIEMMVDYGDDDIYEVLAMIPKEIKDKLPIG